MPLSASPYISNTLSSLSFPSTETLCFKNVLHTDDVNTIADETSSISAGDHAPQSYTDDPGGDIDDPGGGSTNAWSSFSNGTTSASTSSRASASYVSSSLTTRVSSLFLSDRSTADVVECSDVD